jgi:hypothetical protein
VDAVLTWEVLYIVVIQALLILWGGGCSNGGVVEIEATIED